MFQTHDVTLNVTIGCLNIILISVRTDSLQNCQKHSVYQSTNICKLWKQNA